MPLERNRLFIMKCLEVFVPGVLLKPMECLGGSIHGCLVMAFGILQVGEIFALDSFVFGVVFYASSAEFMGNLWFWKSSECVIEGHFHGFECAKTVRTSGDHTNFVVETFDRTA